MYFSCSISAARRLKISSDIGMKVGHLPFVYLGVHLFRGASKKVVLQPVAYAFMSKLESWK